MVKRRFKDAGLPSRLSPHSFRVTGNYRSAGVPLDNVQYLAWHTPPANDQALRPAAEEGHADHRGTDFDLTNDFNRITYEVPRTDSERRCGKCQSEVLAKASLDAHAEKKD